MGSASDFKIKSRPGVDPWKMFTGDDLCYPVEMFVHIMEYKSGSEEGSDDNKLARDVINHIPDFKDGNSASAGCPAAAWKQKIVSKYSHSGVSDQLTEEDRDPLSLMKWTEMKPDLLEEFVSKTDYSLREKLHLLQSLGKGPYEDSQAYLIRIRCIVSLLVENKIHSSLDELPPPTMIWVRVLFLFGLDEMEQNLVIEESDLKSLDELCKVLAMPEVKMIRRADDMMNKEQDADDGPPRKRLKKGKKRKNYVDREHSFDNCEGGSVYQPELEDDDEAVVKQERVEDNYDDEGLDQDDDTSCDQDYKPDFPIPEVQMEEDGSDHKSEKQTSSTTAKRLPKKLWECVFCDCAPYKTRSELWAHQDDKHEGFKGKCEPCNMMFLKVSELTVHNNQLHPEEVKSRKYKKYVSEHIHAQQKEASTDESADKPFKIQGTVVIKGAKGKAVAYICGICNHQLFSQLDMAKHTREVHSGRRYKCHLCDFKTKGRDEMGAHLLSIHDFEASEVRVFRCTYPGCGFKAISSCKVKDHVDARHLRLLQFSCEICGRQFRYKGALQSHQKDHHPDDAKKLKLPLKHKYHCEDCDKVFTAPCYLKIHREKKHRNGRPPDHLCPKCGRAFLLEIYLKRHLKEFHDRDGDKPCPYCPPSDKKPAKLYSRASLYQHIQGIHNRNLVCGLCHLAFSSVSLLIVHYRLTHLKYKQYRCKECNIKFSRTSNIRDHIMRKHFDGDFQPTFEFFRDNPIVEDFRKSDPANYPTKEHILAQIAVDAEKGHSVTHHGEKYPFPQQSQGHLEEEKYVPPPNAHDLEQKYVPPTGHLPEAKYANEK